MSYEYEGDPTAEAEVYTLIDDGDAFDVADLMAVIEAIIDSLAAAGAGYRVAYRNWSTFADPNETFLDVGFYPPTGEFVIGQGDGNVRIAGNQFYSSVEVDPGGNGDWVALFCDDGEDTLLAFRTASEPLDGNLYDPDVLSYDGDQTWTLQANNVFPADFAALTCVHISSLDRWVLLGESEAAGNDAACYTSDNDGVTWTNRAMGGGGNDRPVFGATVRQSSALAVAVAHHPAANPTDIWRSVDGITWSVVAAATDTLTNAIVKGKWVDYSKPSQLFMLCTNETTPAFYTSSDAISWTKKTGTFNHPDLGDVVGFCAIGRVWAVLRQYSPAGGDEYVLSISRDTGDTWETVGTISTGVAPAYGGGLIMVNALRYKGGRLIATFGAAGGGGSEIAFSLATEQP